MSAIYNFLGNSIYFVMAAVAAWGAYCVIIVFNRVKQKQFKSEQIQSGFLQALEEPLLRGEYEQASQICTGDRRALCQLCQLAIDNRQIGFAKIKQLVSDRFQRDVLQDLEFRLSWVITVIKTGPMLGLLGTVLGMMAAFEKLAASKTVQADKLAGDIQFALITTALGLAIALPLTMAVAYININIRKMEDMVSFGLNQFLEVYRQAIIRHPVS
ncbi:MAG: MotA/TolQ/ExbB proton channel family protein [Pirellulaceae bacterium]